MSDSEEEEPTVSRSNLRRLGKQRIKYEFIQDKSKRGSTASRRKKGILKALGDHEKLTGSETCVLIFYNGKLYLRASRGFSFIRKPALFASIKVELQEGLSRGSDEDSYSSGDEEEDEDDDANTQPTEKKSKTSRKRSAPESTRAPTSKRRKRAAPSSPTDSESSEDEQQISDVPSTSTEVRASKKCKREAPSIIADQEDDGRIFAVQPKRGRPKRKTANV